jgi:hypothetical protein
MKKPSQRKSAPKSADIEAVALRSDKKPVRIRDSRLTVVTGIRAGHSRC